MDHTPLHIRDAVPADLPALLDLYRHLAPDDKPPSRALAGEIFTRFSALEGSAILLGETEGRLVSSCTLAIIPNLTRGGRPYGLIENVVTHGDFRNRGFGKAMLDAASDKAWGAGCYKIMLLTGSQRPKTLAFYRKARFEQSKTGFQKRRLPPRPET